MKKIPVKILKWVFRKLAQLTIWRFEPQVIAITGSAGKTSAKEAIFSVMKNFRRVRKSTGNLNNELGIPLAVIGGWTDEQLKLVSRGQPAGEKLIQKAFFWLKAVLFALFQVAFKRRSKYPEILVLEYAADQPGDIKYLVEIARPYIGVVTAVGDIPVHVEFFSGPEAVAREKGKLAEAVPAEGFVIMNFDNEIVMAMKERIRARIITYGFNEGADIGINNFENRSENNEPMGISFKVEYGGSFVPVILKNCFGKAQAYAAAAAACVGLIYDLNLVEVFGALAKNYSPAKSRMNLLKGLKNSYIIDDSYNASPLSVREALETLFGLPAKRKIAVLGDMLELGKYSIEAHEEVGKWAGSTADILATIGPRAKFIAESARNSGMEKNKVLSFDTVAEASKVLQELIKPGDLVLVKASRGVGLERLVEDIKMA